MGYRLLWMGREGGAHHTGHHLDYKYPFTAFLCRALSHLLALKIVNAGLWCSIITRLREEITLRALCFRERPMYTVKAE